MVNIIKETDQNSLKKANQALKDGKVICFATETVYALACDASNDEAVQKLYKIKRRSFEKPIAIFVPNVDMAKNFLEFTSLEEKIAKKFMPGALTLILEKKSDILSSFLNQNSKTVGLRIPQHSFSLKLLQEFRGPVAATSANVSGDDNVLNIVDIGDDFSNKIDLIIDGGLCHLGTESTVIRVDDGKNIVILREGLIKKSELILN